MIMKERNNYNKAGKMTHAGLELNGLILLKKLSN